MVVRLVLGLALTLVVAVVAARRAWWLYTLISSGQPDARRAEGLGGRVRAQFVEVFGQRKLLRWSIPGLAHLFTMWALHHPADGLHRGLRRAVRRRTSTIPLIGRWAVLGFLQDFIAMHGAALDRSPSRIIRIRNAPERRARTSRFYGSHTGGAWLILFMIFNVLWTLFVFRGASSALGNLPYESGAWASIGARVPLLRAVAGRRCSCSRPSACMLHIGVMLIFLVIVAYCKHLHIFIAPINVSAKRMPKALGPLQPIEHEGKPIDFEDPGEDASFGRGKIEDFTWKGMLDFATCTECGRCQSQCPAWNTGKPLSPKLLIMDLRDHMFAKAPYMIGGKDMPDEGAIDPGRRGRPRPRVPRRPGVGLRAPPRLRPPAGHPPARRRRRVPAASSTRTCCGPAPPAARASSSARSTSSTSTTSSTCAATRS